MFIAPTPEQIDQLQQSASESDRPVVMLNLLKFKPDGGAASYERYAQAALPLLTKIGARVVWYGSGDSVVIGDTEADKWDSVLLVEYPSLEIFLKMALGPEYAEFSHFRTEALADSRLIACSSY